MDAAREPLLKKLTKNLDELADIYRQLLAIVIAERDLLIAADIEKLDKHNETKESLMMKARFADIVRVKIAEEMAELVGADRQNPRLLDIAQKLGGAEGLRLREIHKELDTIVRKISTTNKDNEIYAQSALKTLNGAMTDLKESIAGKKTYGGKGRYKIGPAVSGNFVSKEA